MLLSDITRWRPLAFRIASKHGLPGAVVLGMIAQESSGNPYAIRVERGFWRRYFDGIQRNVLGNAYGPDDRWLAYPDLASASYGLMQILWPVAIERGAKLRYPTELCDPELNVELGCQHLRHLQRRVATLDAALLRYNGGGDPAYPRRIHTWTERLQQVPTQPT